MSELGYVFPEIAEHAIGCLSFYRPKIRYEYDEKSSCIKCSDCNMVDKAASLSFIVGCNQGFKFGEQFFKTKKVG